VVPITISWYRVAASQRLLNQSYWTKGSSWLSWSQHTITWLTVMEYLCHKWPRICCVCRIQNLVLSSFMTYHRLCNKRNTKGPTSGAGHMSSPSNQNKKRRRINISFQLVSESTFPNHCILYIICDFDPEFHQCLPLSSLYGLVVALCTVHCPVVNCLLFIV
jgi:hypothetical protein